MNTIAKVLSSVVLSSFLGVLSIGYANVSNNLTVTGAVNIEPQENVFISDVIIPTGVNAVCNSYYASTLNSTITLGNTSNSTVSFNITVYNNTNETYGFNAVKYMIDDTTYDNSNISFETSLERRDEVLSYDDLTFSITFMYKDSTVSENKVLNSILNFEFLPLDEIPEDEGEIAVTGVMGRFEEILNTPAEYTKLTNQMDDNWANGRYNDSYMGTVLGASDADIALLEEMFAGNLILNINGVDTEVTILIKRENIDGSRNTGDADGNEMTVYMTTDPLTERGKSVPVYAAAYTSSDDGTSWSQIGHMFEGTATVNNYFGFSGSGSFNTDTWKDLDGNTIEEVIEAL